MGKQERIERAELVQRRHAAEARERILGFWRAGALNDSESMRISLALQTLERETTLEIRRGSPAAPSATVLLSALVTRLAPELSQRLAAATTGKH